MKKHLAAILASLAVSSTTGCVDLSDEPVAAEPAVSETTQAATIANRPVSNLTGAQLDAQVTSAKTDGFRPISISVYGEAGYELYAAVFVERAGVDWKVMRGTGASTFQTAFSNMAGAGYKPTKLSFEGTADNPVWAAVFEKTSSGIPYVRHALVSGSALTNNTIQYWLKKAVDENLIPTTFSAYGSAASPRYAIVLEPNPSRTAWAVGRMSWNRTTGEWNGTGLGDSLADFQTLFNVRTATGSRPSIISNTLDNRYAVMFREDSVGNFVAKADLTKTQLDAEIVTQAGFGRIPIEIEGRGTSWRRFAATFAATDIPYTKTFSAVGSSSFRDGAIPAVDDLMKSFMAANDVRNAGLAVLDGTRLVYARGYNLTEPGTRKVGPTSYFRLASLSKTVTSFEIMKLVEENEIAVGDTVQQHLNMTRLDGQPIDPRFANITIQELLSHNYPSLMDADGTVNCLKRDLDVWSASAMGTTLPVGSNIAVRYGLQDANLIYKRTSSCYSNFAYDLLGLIVEAKRGTTFQAAITNDLFTPSSITRFRPASNDPTLTDEAMYRQPTMATWSSATQAGAYAGAYGGDNFVATLAAGGMSMAPVDLARLLAVSKTKGTSLIYDTVPATYSRATVVDTMLNMGFGFDQILDEGSRFHWIKGGLLEGLQSGIAHSPSGLTYVVMFARNGLSSTAPEHAWYPHWEALEDVLDASSLENRTDQFPTYGMPAL